MGWHLHATWIVIRKYCCVSKGLSLCLEHLSTGVMRSIAKHLPPLSGSALTLLRRAIYFSADCMKYNS